MKGNEKMKRFILFICLCLTTWTFFYTHNHKENQKINKEIKEDEIELKTHIVNTSDTLTKDKPKTIDIFHSSKAKYKEIDGIQLLDLSSYIPKENDYLSKDPIIAEMYFCYYSFSRDNNGIHYYKIYSTFNNALKEATHIHTLSPYNEYKTYTIEGLPQCGYKIYFIP